MNVEDVIDDFEVRVSEIEYYFEALDKLMSEGTKITNVSGNRVTEIDLAAEVINTLKATCFLLLYNLVESSVRSGFSALYHSVNGEDSSLRAFRAEYRQVWIDQLFVATEDPSANRKTYRDVARRIVELLVDEASLGLDPTILRISGNLDADKIRKLLGDHAVAQHVHPQAYGGVDLVTVKEQRNALAHGNQSFSECGRDYTIDDLTRIKTRTIIFLRSALRNIRNYIEKRQYAA